MARSLIVSNVPWRIGKPRDRQGNIIIDPTTSDALNEAYRAHNAALARIAVIEQALAPAVLDHLYNLPLGEYSEAA